MKRLLVTCALAALVSIEAGAAEYICKLPGGKTSIQGTPCAHDARTAYQNTRRYETQEEMQERVLDADRRINEPMRREVAIQEYERAEARRQQQEEDEAKARAEREQARLANEQAKEQARVAREHAKEMARIAREQELLEEVRRARRAAEDAESAARRARR